MSMRASSCPCCGSSTLLRHVRHGQIYWFCQSCRQEVSLLSVNRVAGVGTVNTGTIPQPAVKV
jgi:ribosomal protein L37AE/L43A